MIFWTWIITNWKVSAGIIGTGILILVILGMVAGIKQCNFNSNLNQENKEVQNLNKQAENINANLANLQTKQAEAEVVATQANANLEKVRQDVNTAKIESNKALENVNKVTNANYNGTTLPEAEKARCAAFPESCPK